MKKKLIIEAIDAKKAKSLQEGVWFDDEVVDVAGPETAAEIAEDIMNILIDRSKNGEDDGFYTVKLENYEFLYDENGKLLRDKLRVVANIIWKKWGWEKAHSLSADKFYRNGGSERGGRGWIKEMEVRMAAEEIRIIGMADGTKYRIYWPY